MRLFIMLLAAVFGLFSAAYQPAETPLFEAPIITQQEQIAPSEAPAIEPIAQPTPPQESDELPAIVEDVSAAVAVIADEPEAEPIVSAPAPVAVIAEPAAVELAKTGAPEDIIPTVVEHAKTGYEGEDTPAPLPPAIEPETPAESADITAAIATAEAFAADTYGVTIDPTLDFNNSAYRFPAAVPVTASQETLNAKAIDIVDYTFQQQIHQFGVTIEKIRETDIRCRVYVEQAEYDLKIYCMYA